MQEILGSHWTTATGTDKSLFTIPRSDETLSQQGDRRVIYPWKPSGSSEMLHGRYAGLYVAGEPEDRNNSRKLTTADTHHLPCRDFVTEENIDNYYLGKQILICKFNDGQCSTNTYIQCVHWKLFTVEVYELIILPLNPYYICICSFVSGVCKGMCVRVCMCVCLCLCVCICI